MNVNDVGPIRNGVFPQIFSQSSFILYLSLMFPLLLSPFSTFLQVNFRAGSKSAEQKNSSGGNLGRTCFANNQQARASTNQTNPIIIGCLILWNAARSFQQQQQKPTPQLIGGERPLRRPSQEQLVAVQTTCSTLATGAPARRARGTTESVRPLGDWNALAVLLSY